MSTPLPNLFPISEAAQQLGRTEDSIRAFCIRNGIGTKLYGRRWLSPSEIEQIRSTLRDGPGNPQMSDPAAQAKLLKKAKRARKQSAAKKRTTN